MNHTCYVIHSKKLIFRDEGILRNYIINLIAEDCHSEKKLNRMMGEFFKNNVKVTDYSNVLKLVYNSEFRMVGE